MIVLPSPITILQANGDEYAGVDAQIVALDTTTAKTRIDFDWWSQYQPEQLQEEQDRNWRWADLVQQRRYSPDRFQCAGVVDGAGKWQGAIILRFDAKSQLEDGCGAVMIERLASAPWNRERILKPRSCCDVGTQLVAYAIRVSISVGLEGRVNGFPVPEAVDFYLRLGFVPTELVDGEGLMLYEVPGSVARAFLQR